MSPLDPSPQSNREVRGARDLVDLWRGLPAAALCYALGSHSVFPTPMQVSDWLRARAWREHCALGTGADACIERGEFCIGKPISCAADRLFPLGAGGGRAWRMATLSPVYWPSTQVLHVLAIGEIARPRLDWVELCLREQFGLNGATRVPVERLGCLELQGATRWLMRIVTPWVAGKSRMGALLPPSQDDVHHQLVKSMRVRAHKISALCAADTAWQRLAGHLSHHVADAMLAQGLVVREARIGAEMQELTSKNNKGSWIVEVWLGEAILDIHEELLPWLSLIAFFGGGENVDKGFGCVELVPIAGSG